MPPESGSSRARLSGKDNAWIRKRADHSLSESKAMASTCLEIRFDDQTGFARFNNSTSTDGKHGCMVNKVKRPWKVSKVGILAVKD